MKRFSNINVTAPLLIVGVFYYLLSIIYHSYAIEGDKIWICFFYSKDAMFILGLLYIMYKLVFKTCSIFMLLSIALYKVGSTIADIWGCINSKTFEEYGLFLTNPKLLIFVCLSLATILIVIIKFYRLWTK